MSRPVKQKTDLMRSVLDFSVIDDIDGLQGVDVDLSMVDEDVHDLQQVMANSRESLNRAEEWEESAILQSKEAGALRRMTATVEVGQVHFSLVCS